MGTLGPSSGRKIVSDEGRADHRVGRHAERPSRLAALDRSRRVPHTPPAHEVTRIATVAVALLVAAGCAGGHARPTAAALRHHYFLIGQRKCERSLKKAEAQRGQAELLAFIDTRGYPKRYRAAVGAGCRAARR